MRAMTNAKTVTTQDGVRIAYEVEGAGPPLVLIHGITENRRTWDDFVPMLRDAYRVIRLDLRGHGESGKGESYDLAALAGDVAEVVNATSDEPPHVVGHSLGGLVATGYAAFFPARSAVNVDQSFEFSDFMEIVHEMVPALRGDGFQDAINNEMLMLAGDALPESEKARLRTFRESAHQDVVLALWEPLLTQTPEELTAMVEALLPAVRVPYLALHGTDLGPDYAEWITGLIPTATVETWDGLGHWLHLIERERFVARVRAFTAAADAAG